MDLLRVSARSVANDDAFDVAIIRQQSGLSEARWASVLASIGGRGHADAGRAAAMRVAAGPPLPFCSVIDVVARRPGLVLLEEHGIRALLAGLYRFLSRRLALFVVLDDAPARLTWCQRAVLLVADGVLVDGAAAARAVAAEVGPACAVMRLGTPEIDGAFFQQALTRTGDVAQRIVAVTDLTPQSGSADLLTALITWSDLHPEKRVEITWIGTGDLAGVLAAQPLPNGMSQRFLGALAPDRLATVFGECGILVVTDPGGNDRLTVLRAMAAGLVVLGSSHSRAVGQHVCDLTGALFDPLDPQGLFCGLDGMLRLAPRDLDTKRQWARDSVRRQAPGEFGVRLGRRSRRLRTTATLASSPRQAR